MTNNWKVKKCDKCGMEYPIQNLHVCNPPVKEIDDMLNFMKGFKK